jgi:conjugative transposon TraK protein
MFTQFKNIDTAFKHIKTFSIVFLVANVITMCFGSYIQYRLTSQERERVYILSNGKLLEAVASDKKSNLEVELRYHIKAFHGYFFNLIPDDKSIREEVGKSLYLADQSAKKQYDNLRESGYYNNMIAANITQRIEVDSIALDIDHIPYRFTCYATQKLIRASGTAERKLVTRGQVLDLEKKTDNNSNGFLIQNWEILENVDKPNLP